MLRQRRHHKRDSCNNRRDVPMREVKVWGGIGEKKSNKGTQWYIQDRIYDSDGLAPALTTFKSDYLIIIRQRREV